MKQNKTKILSILSQLYPNPTTELEFETPFQLLIATILSAQCTDKVVNRITSVFFCDHPDVYSMSSLTEEQIAGYIKSAGLWKTKAKHIKMVCEILINEHHGLVPQTREELENLPGVGRKTANVVLANAFSIPAIAVDTHVQRVANRLGLAQSKTPLRTEKQLMELIPKHQWSDAHHWLILHGRRVCRAQRPLCDQCPLLPYCPQNGLKSN
ncbi:MAG: endonuclease III [Firmicutes bacterium]|jgi:endonuclease-3|nr:endonuclease III [Bacillota bacterium]